MKLVMMKSSNERLNASSAAPAIPGATNGSVTRLKVSNSFAYKQKLNGTNWKGRALGVELSQPKELY